jgi:hypothetical protein
MLTVAPLAIMVAMLVAIYFQAQKRVRQLPGSSAPPRTKPLPWFFWVWLAGAAAFIAVTQWTRHH